MALTLEQYADYLDTRGLSWPAAPDVDRPRAKPHLVALPEIRAVVWTAYGTLLAISGGELLFEHPNQFVMDIALDKTVQEFKMWASMTRKPGQPAEYLRQMYTRVRNELVLTLSPGEKYPEVLAEQVWEGIIKKLLQKEYQWDVGFYGSLNEYSRKVAYFFHASLQGVAAHKGASAALQHVAAVGCRQGLLDNGQCFTPVQVARCLKRQDAGAAPATWFEPALSVLSYQMRARKPSERLFRQLLTQLQEEGISPGQVLHVGSHAERDIAPARKLGMRTALFAGNRESLRVTTDQLKESASRPDVLMTKLNQISEILPGS
jgi:FMN phosphatase YigB (HAD superfamily)